jgi:hypothetical protein
MCVFLHSLTHNSYLEHSEVMNHKTSWLRPILCLLQVVDPLWLVVFYLILFHAFYLLLTQQISNCTLSREFDKLSATRLTKMNDKYVYKILAWAKKIILLTDFIKICRFFASCLKDCHVVHPIYLGKFERSPKLDIMSKRTQFERPVSRPQCSRRRNYKWGIPFKMRLISLLVFFKLGIKVSKNICWITSRGNLQLLPWGEFQKLL